MLFFSQDNSQKEWAFEKAITIQTYSDYHPVPVPYNIGSLLVLGLYRLRKREKSKFKIKRRETFEVSRRGGKHWNVTVIETYSGIKEHVFVKNLRKVGGGGGRGWSNMMYTAILINFVGSKPTLKLLRQTFLSFLVVSLRE